MSDYKNMSTGNLLRLLISRSARKAHHESVNYNAFTDSSDERILDDVMDELEERIDRSAARNASSHGIAIGG